MSPFELLILLLSFRALASPILLRQTQDFIFAGDAPFSVDPGTLAAALNCPNGNPTSSSPPVLLVHGTAATGDQTWGQGYVPALLANGYTACYVTLPNRAMGDMQISSEYIAYGIHRISQLSGGLQTAVVAHSQGNPNTLWTLKFWPSTQKVVRAFVSLSPDFQGIRIGDTKLSAVCNSGLCQPSLWQQSAGSQYYNALRSGDFRALVPITVVWSKADEVVLPPSQNAQLPGATIIAVQDLCPLRIVDHVFMTIDSAGFNLALDALNNGGKADLSRVRKKALSICLRITAKNMDVTVANQLEGDWNSVIDGFLDQARVSSEPALMAYAVSGT